MPKVYHFTIIISLRRNKSFSSMNATDQSSIAEADFAIQQQQQQLPVQEQVPEQVVSEQVGPEQVSELTLY